MAFLGMTAIYENSCETVVGRGPKNFAHTGSTGNKEEFDISYVA
jgi:hypothetical protein